MRNPAQNLRAAGFADPFVLLMIAACVWLVYLAIQPTPAPEQQGPLPIPGASIAYQPYVYADSDTGCQYLSTHLSSALVPRIAADGKTHLGCKEGS